MKADVSLYTTHAQKTNVLENFINKYSDWVQITARRSLALKIHTMLDQEISPPY